MSFRLAGESRSGEELLTSARQKTKCKDRQNVLLAAFAFEYGYALVLTDCFLLSHCRSRRKHIVFYKQVGLSGRES